MKIVRNIGFGILTFFIGLLFMFFIAGIFNQPGGGELTSSLFNSGIMALVSSILFLCSVVVTCTLMLINSIKRH